MLRLPITTLLLLFAGWATTCADLDPAAAPADSTAAEAAANGMSVEAVLYELDWRWGNATPLPEGGWVTETDLGYRVTVERGYLTTYSLSLVACSDIVASEERAASPSVLASGWRWVQEHLGARTAWAGHSTQVDPSALPVQLIESLAAPGPALAEVTFAPETYCRVHYLVARATALSAGLPDDRDMVGTSLVLEGTVVGPDGAERPLALQTSSAYGALTDVALADAIEPDVRGLIGGRVRIERRLDTLFDGVDFEGMDARDQARQVLANVVNQAAVEVVAGL